MFKRLNKISVKYASAFIAVTLALIAVIIFDQFLVQTVANRMNTFSSTFYKANSALLNADRDLYQSRVFTLKFMSLPPHGDDAENAIAAHKDNASNSFQRVNEFKTLLADYPQITTALSGYETIYKTWRQGVDKAIKLKIDYDTRGAKEQLFGPTLSTFSELRSMYNKAENLLTDKIEKLAASTDAQIRQERIIVIVVSLIVALVSLIIALTGPLMISRAIRQIKDRIQQITEGDGDLTARIKSRRSDEIGDLAGQFNAFITRIDDTLQAVRRSTKQVTGASTEIAQGSRDLSKRTEQSAANLEETSASMEQLTATVQNTADAAEQGQQTAQTSAEIAQRGAEAMRELEKTMGDISTSTSEIETITSLIDNIAFQTNLLALNASVEAARAGEHGRGFAVVAEEVRTLAGRAGEASRDIHKLVETSVSHTQAGTELAQQTGSTIQDVAQSVEQLKQVMTEISSSAREQSEGVGQINTAVAEMDNATQQNSSLVEQTSAAAANASDQAQQLNALIASFRLSDGQPQDNQEAIANEPDVEELRDEPKALPAA